MPFTAAHPAIILPLKYKFSRLFSTTGLVIGSIAPDFAYFLSPLLTTKVSHTLKGVLLFNLPVTIILAILFHGIVREQIIRFLPPFLERRASVAAHAMWFTYLRNNWHIFLFSALIGILSHLFWDSFTHYAGFFVRNFAILRRPIDFFGYALPLCRWLQHFSTIAGLIAISLFVAKLPVYTSVRGRKYGWVYFWLAVVGAGFVLLLVTRPEVRSINQIEVWVVRFLSGCLLAVIVLTAFFKLRQR
ncbi:hypothetical protein ABID22_001336 [Pontibacter aydingkolensis]|uniref:DUF4184 family protein n=1 Tax=Pontibacter aydingkolensis TaxID=1911536 RepID=A0ABS7CNS2_9BACT|nr:DUF4184 family protein [Pontibacter aydingkolensis]MBW7465502.1 DUF4184 family protein [Pontibacter aydingkolensis]